MTALAAETLLAPETLLIAKILLASEEESLKPVFNGLAAFVLLLVLLAILLLWGRGRE